MQVYLYRSKASVLSTTVLQTDNKLQVHGRRPRTFPKILLKCLRRAWRMASFITTNLSLTSTTRHSTSGKTGATMKSKSFRFGRWWPECFECSRRQEADQTLNKGFYYFTLVCNDRDTRTFTLFLFSIIKNNDGRVLAIKYNAPRSNPQIGLGLMPFELDRTNEPAVFDIAWNLQDTSDTIYQEVWDEPWLVSFGSAESGAYVAARRLFVPFVCRNSETPNKLRLEQKVYPEFRKNLISVPADCFKYRLGCFKIIDPQTLHQSIDGYLFDLCRWSFYTCLDYAQSSAL